MVTGKWMQNGRVKLRGKKTLNKWKELCVLSVEWVLWSDIKRIIKPATSIFRKFNRIWEAKEKDEHKNEEIQENCCSNYCVNKNARIRSKLMHESYLTT